MKEYIFNSKFIDLIKDDKFIQLVKGSKNPDHLLENLIFQNPENSSDIKYAFEFIMVAKNDQKTLNSNDSNIILKNIEKRLQINKQKGKTVHYLLWLKIASVIFMIIALGSLLFYYQISKDPLKQFAEEDQGKGDQGLIILSDGSEHILSNNDSKIDYNVSHGEVIIKKRENEEEKFPNSATSNHAVLNQVVVPYGQRQRVVLSDGTTVKLNAGSKMAFPSVFSGKNREVYLKGEGFFEVYKDASHPFIVKTDFVDVKVLGTTFNISAYEDESIASAVLVEGSVNVSQKNKIIGSQSFVLSPGQGCFYSVNDKKSDIRNVDIDFYTSWKDGIYQFKDMPLPELVRKVKKYYNVPVQIEGEELSDTKISGKLVISGNIDEVMQYIAKTVEGNFEQNKNGIYIIKN